MKIKYNKKTDTFSLKRLEPCHLEALYTLLNHTRLGESVYENAAFEMVQAFEKFQQEVPSFNPEDCGLGVQFLEDNVIIVLSHSND